IDYDREIAFVAESTDAKTGERSIVAVARLSKIHGTEDAEFTILVNDRFQGRGLGREIIQRLLQVGRGENLRRVIALISTDNLVMQGLCEDLGFHLSPATEEGRVRAIIDL
ncbi:MAG TPA: GNAT family N-acetyltransferase, partial [Anaerolineae bacterium]